MPVVHEVGSEALTTRMRDVLYLSYDGLTDPLGASQVLPYLVGLARLGYRFTVLSFEKPDRFRLNEASVRAACIEAGIDWRPKPYTKWPPVASTVFDLTQMRRAAFDLHAEKKFSLVHARSVLAAMTGRALKRAKGVRFIFDIRGFWAHERVDGNLWNLKNPLYRVVFSTVRHQEDACYESADRVVSLTHKAKAEILSWSSLRGQPLSVDVIPCCVDLDLFDPERIDAEQKADAKRSLGVEADAFVLSYLGSIGTWYMLPEMLAFFARLLLRRPDAVMLFVTQDDADAIRREATRQSIPASKIVVRSAQRAEVPLLVALSDYSLFFIKPLYSKMASSPTKQGEVMAMGVPIVCNAGIGDTDQILEKYDAGVLVPRFESSAYDAAIEAMLRPNESHSTNARNGAREWFSLARGIDRYRALYEGLVGAGA